MTASTICAKVVPPVLTAILTSRVFVRKEDTVGRVNVSIVFFTQFCLTGQLFIVFTWFVRINTIHIVITSILQMLIIASWITRVPLMPSAAAPFTPRKLNVPVTKDTEATGVNVSKVR